MRSWRVIGTGIVATTIMGLAFVRARDRVPKPEYPTEVYLIALYAIGAFVFGFFSARSIRAMIRSNCQDRRATGRMMLAAACFLVLYGTSGSVFGGHGGVVMEPFSMAVVFEWIHWWLDTGSSRSHTRADDQNQRALNSFLNQDDA